MTTFRRIRWIVILEIMPGIWASPGPEFLSVGRPLDSGPQSDFCMTILALRLSSHSNGVIKLHGDVSRRMLKVDPYLSVTGKKAAAPHFDLVYRHPVDHRVNAGPSRGTCLGATANHRSLFSALFAICAFFHFWRIFLAWLLRFSSQISNCRTRLTLRAGRKSWQIVVWQNSPIVSKPIDTDISS
jgi:hypothetical protein